MSIAKDIIGSYRAPREVLRRRTGPTVREDRALAILMGACLVIFIAQWPRLSREAYLSEEIELDALLAGALFGWLMVAPLVFYILALVSHIVLRLVSGPVSGYEVRMAIFWGLLAATPLFLLAGLTAGFIGDGPQLRVTGFLALGALLAFWIIGLFDVASRQRKAGA